MYRKPLKYTFVNSLPSVYHGRQPLSMYIYHTMTSGTSHQVTPSTHVDLRPRYTDRTSYEMHPESRAELWPRSNNLPLESSLPVPELPIILRYLQCLPAELLQLLNLPVVPQLGGEGASLGPTRQQCAHTWKLYNCSCCIMSVSVSQTNLDIHSLSHSH